MTQHLETRFICDRCKDEDTLPVGGLSSVVPQGWLIMRIGGETDMPPAHLCQDCAKHFNVFMQCKQGTLI